MTEAEYKNFSNSVAIDENAVGRSNVRQRTIDRDGVFTLRRLTETRQEMPMRGAGGNRTVKLNESGAPLQAFARLLCLAAV